MKPVLFNLFGEAIYSYPIFVGASWGLGYSLARENWVKSKGEETFFHILFALIFLFAWIGAKLFFLFFSIHENRADYFANSNFWTGGGFVFYGGLVFSLLGIALVAKFKKDFNFKDVSLFVGPLFLAHGVGRIGCYMAGCCFGKQCDLPFIKYHPVQLYEAGLLFVLFYFSQKFLKKNENEKVILCYLWGYSLCRFSLEFLRGDAVRGLHYGLSTSQWTSIILLLTGVFFFIFWRRSGKRNTL